MAVTDVEFFPFPSTVDMLQHIPSPQPQHQQRQTPVHLHPR
jgi:hypothetical protein